MIDHVLPKECITAEKTNQIIDKANGLQTPSDRFVNTPNGTLTPPPDYTPGFSFFPVPEHILQTKYGASLQMTQRGQTRNDDKYGTTQKMSWFCYLGPNTATLKSKVCPYEDIDSIWLGSGTSSLFKEVTDNMIDSLSAVGNWVDVGAYDEESVKVAIVKISTSEQSQQQLPPKYAAVICGGDLDGFSQLLDSDKYQQYDKAEQVGKHSYTIAAIDNNDRVFQLGYGPDLLNSALDYPVVDSQISALQLSSLGEEVHAEVSGKLSTETVYRDLFSFGLSGTVNASHLSGTDPGDIEFVMRESKTTQNSGKRVNYLKYSDLSAALKTNGVPVDADVAAAQTSSLQTRELDNGTKVEEMFNFHLSDTVDISLDNLSAYDIVVRNPNDGSPYVQYGKLSIDIYPDSEGDSGQKSVAWLTDQHELQLYKFNENGLTSAISTTVETNGNAERLVPDEYEFVFRKGGAAGELEYGKVQLSVHADELSGDSQASEQKSISVENNIIQLYHMERAGKHVSSEVPTHFDEPQSILSDDYEFVVRKGGAGGEIDYTTVKLRQAKLSVDSDSTQKSVQYNPTSNELQLYKMHENGEAGHKVTITSALTPLLPADYELVVRKNGAGGEIAYTKLSAALSSTIELDTQATAQQKSLEWKTQNNRTYAQLYKMDAAGEATEQVDLKNAKNSYQDLLPDDEEFVIRSAQGGEIKYKNVGVLLSAYNGGGGGSADISVDSEIPALQHSSLQHISQGGNDYYELYGFHDPTNTETSLSGYEYVVRHNDGNGNVSVKYLSADLPAAACPASFDYYTRPDGTHWLRGGYFQQARRFYWVSSTEITAAGMIQLSVSMEYTSRSGIIQGASSLPSPNVSAMYIPLWNIGQDMKPTFDYRHAPMLPRWE